MTVLPQPLSAPPDPQVLVTPPPAGLATSVPAGAVAGPAGAAAVPADARYDHLARTPNRRWFHAPAALASFVVAFLTLGIGIFVVVFVLAAVAGVPLDGFLLDDAWVAAAGLLFIAAALPALVLVVRFVERRRPGTLSSVTSRLRVGWLAACLLPALAVSVGANVALEVFVPTAGPLVGWSAFLSVAIVAVALTPFQAAAEEYVFRGWLVQSFGALVRNPWPGVLVSAALFALVHEGATSNVWGFADLVIFAVVLSLVTIRTGGLEAAIALHIVHNSTGWVLSAAYGTTASVADYSQVGPEMLVVTVISLAIYTAVVLVMARRRGLATRSAAA